jgi:hypothetical protein
VAFDRILRRRAAEPPRRAHADPEPDATASHSAGFAAFDRVSVAAPWIEVDTTAGYEPGFDEIIAFVNGRA